MSDKNLPPDSARYFIAVIPPSPIAEEVVTLKNYFKDTYQSRASLNSPPHITLHMPFLWREKGERELVEALNNFAEGQEAIEISLLGFGAFPPRVIFISVERNEKLILLQRQLERFCKTELNLFNAQYKENPFHPHLTLAFRDLKKPMFSSAWSEFEHKSFQASFIMNGINLLKHDGKRWQPVHRFHF